MRKVLERAAARSKVKEVLRLYIWHCGLGKQSVIALWRNLRLVVQ